MARPPEYVWFVAVVWPDANGVPTATIREWDRAAGRLGPTVHVVHFGAKRPFRREIESLGYELVEAQLADSVTPKGVRIALRRETVPVYVYA